MKGGKRTYSTPFNTQNTGNSFGRNGMRNGGDGWEILLFKYISDGRRT